MFGRDAEIKREEHARAQRLKAELANTDMRKRDHQESLRRQASEKARVQREADSERAKTNKRWAKEHEQKEAATLSSAIESLTKLLTEDGGVYDKWAVANPVTANQQAEKCKDIRHDMDKGGRALAKITTLAESTTWITQKQEDIIRESKMPQYPVRTIWGWMTPKQELEQTLEEHKARVASIDKEGLKSMCMAVPLLSAMLPGKQFGHPPEWRKRRTSMVFQFYTDSKLSKTSESGKAAAATTATEATKTAAAAKTKAAAAAKAAKAAKAKAAAQAKAAAAAHAAEEKAANAAKAAEATATAEAAKAVKAAKAAEVAQAKLAAEASQAAAEAKAAQAEWAAEANKVATAPVGATGAAQPSPGATGGAPPAGMTGTAGPADGAATSATGSAGPDTHGLRGVQES